MLSALIYLTPLCITLFGAFGDPDVRRRYIFLACISIFFILAMRLNVGYDYGEYLFRLSENIPPREPIAQLIFYFSRWTSIYPIYFAINALISIVLLYRVAKKENNIWIIINYIAIPWFFVESFSAVRQALSMVLAVAAYHHFNKKENFQFLAFAGLSASAHFASIPFLIMLGMLNFNYSKYLTYIYFFIISIVTWVFLNLNFNLTIILENLAVLQYYTNGRTFGLGQLILAAILVVVSSGSIRTRNSSLILWVGLLIFAVCLNIDSALSRLAWFFFVPYLWFDWRLIFGWVRLDGVTRLFPFLGLGALLLVYLWFKSTDELNSLIPYQSYLSALFG